MKTTLVLLLFALTFFGIKPGFTRSPRLSPLWFQQYSLRDEPTRLTCPGRLWRPDLLRSNKQGEKKKNKYIYVCTGGESHIFIHTRKYIYIYPYRRVLPSIRMDCISRSLAMSPRHTRARGRLTKVYRNGIDRIRARRPCRGGQRKRTPGEHAKITISSCDRRICAEREWNKRFIVSPSYEQRETITPEAAAKGRFRSDCTDVRYTNSE